MLVMMRALLMVALCWQSVNQLLCWIAASTVLDARIAGVVDAPLKALRL